jgi:hypothetical protein
MLEHERAERQHRLGDLHGLANVADAFGSLDDVVDEPIDPGRAGRPENRDLVARKVLLVEEALASL